MNEERMRILRMVAEGKITPEQAAELLAALDARPGHPDGEHISDGEGGQERRRPRWLRVRVTDTRTGHVRVNVSVPFKLVEVGSKLGARWMPDELGGINIPELLATVVSGSEDGKIVEVTDEESGEHVVVYVE